MISLQYWHAKNPPQWFQNLIGKSYVPISKNIWEVSFFFNIVLLRLHFISSLFPKQANEQHCYHSPLPTWTCLFNYRCDILRTSEQYMRSPRLRNTAHNWFGINRLHFNNLQYCATLKSGYTFWRYVFGANPMDRDPARLVKAKFSKTSSKTVSAFVLNTWHWQHWDSMFWSSEAELLW